MIEKISREPPERKITKVLLPEQIKAIKKFDKLTEELKTLEGKKSARKMKISQELKPLMKVLDVRYKGVGNNG
jgi:hypothetical protein